MQKAKAHGCQNILALRGDPVAGTSTWTPTPGGFHNAVDLVRYIHETHPGDFCVAVAGFPQGHPESPDTPEGKQQEIDWFQSKSRAAITKAVIGGASVPTTDAPSR